MCDFITLSITEISPWDAGDYECQVSFTPKISRIIETLQSNLLSLAMSQKPPAITIEFYQTGEIGRLFYPNVSSDHSIKYQGPNNFWKSLSELCSCCLLSAPFLHTYCHSFIILACCLPVTGKLKLPHITKSSQSLSMWGDSEQKPRANINQ